MLKGISASNGIALGKAYRIETIEFNIEKQSISDAHVEVERLNQALNLTKEDLIRIRDKALESMGQDKANIFEAHLLVASDPELFEQVTSMIEREQVNAEFALVTVRDQFLAIFESLDNEYMRERAHDIKDVTDRILAKLLNLKLSDLSLIQEEVI